MGYLARFSSQKKQIYREIVLPLIDAAFRRTKITFFAYGQTGSGKTYTMLGDTNKEDGIKLPGLYILAADEIFRYLERVRSHREMKSLGKY